MDMEAPQEAMGSNDMSLIVKGKRTKRQRPPSPLALAMNITSSGSSSGGEGGGSSGGGDGGEDDFNFPSPTSSMEFAESTEEEEDMANCLILLAQGHGRDSHRQIEESGGMERYSSRRFTEAATTTTGKAGFYVYECKTCNRCFPSFQALGGHRASHKKPKAMVEEKKALMVMSSEEVEGQFNQNSPPLPLNRALFSTNKSRVHECSICGSEFSSGQALGGHMRRHRSTVTMATVATTAVTTSESQESKKPRNVLPLDLNLPAPQEEDHHHRESKFSFSSNPPQPPLLFSASALVDCHY